MKTAVKTNTTRQKKGFSQNGKVSLRQIKRMMFLEIFGLATLVLPGPLAKLCGTDGVFAMLLAAMVWSLVLRLQKWDEKEYRGGGEVSVSQGTDVWIDIMRSFLQIVLFVAAGGFVMYLLVSVVERQLLGTGYLWIVIGTILVAGGYGIMKGVESRARIYEILFWVLLIPLGAILLIGLWNIEPDYWLPVFACSPIGFFLGTAACLAGFLPAALCLLLRPACEEPESVAVMGAKTVWWAGVASAGVYLLLVGVFQTKLLAVLKYPILSLMSVVEMPGNLLERLDAPMMIIWFFCIFALFHSMCYYAVDGIQRLFPKRKNRGRKVVIAMVLILASALLLLLQGCGKKDPEDHLYPLAVGIEYEEGKQKLNVAYAYPEAMELLHANSLFQAQEQLVETSDKKLDLNHMKVFLVNRALLKDPKQQEQLFAYFLENESMAWNACIVVTEEKMEDLFVEEWTNEKALGLYLENLLKNRDDLKDKSVFTVKDYMSLYKNKNETRLVPLVTLRENQFFVDSYCILKRGEDVGTLSVKESDYARVLMNDQKTVSILLKETVFVTLQDMKLEREISKEQGGVIRQKITVKANIKLSADWIYAQNQKDDIRQQAKEVVERELEHVIQSGKKQCCADLTDSFILLPGCNRSLWEEYKDKPDLYEEKLETVIDVQLKMIET